MGILANSTHIFPRLSNTSMLPLIFGPPNAGPSPRSIAGVNAHNTLIGLPSWSWRGHRRVNNPNGSPKKGRTLFRILETSGSRTPRRQTQRTTGHVQHFSKRIQGDNVLISGCRTAACDIRVREQLANQNKCAAGSDREIACATSKGDCHSL